MKIAGLNLSSIDIHNLSTANYNIIYKALLENIEQAYGEIDRTVPELLVNNLCHYIKINLIENYTTFKIGKACEPDLSMALCIYALPERSENPTIKKYLEIIKTLNLESNKQIKFFRSQPYSFANVLEIAEIVKKEKKALNITGFSWKGCVKELFAIVNDQLLSLSYKKLEEINRKYSHSPLLIATKVIYLIEILHYINQHRKEPGFMVLMDIYRFNEHTLRGFTREVLNLLKQALLELEAMPDKSQESIVNSCSLLLLRAAYMLREAVMTKDPKAVKRVSPDH